MEIKIIPSEEIDRKKWDSCVYFAAHGNVYSYAWYLDITCEDWIGLIEGDYESVMAIPIDNKKAYTPDFIYKLGMNSVHVPSQTRLEAFTNAIPNDITVSSLLLNESMKRTPELKKISKTSNNIWALTLTDPYEKSADNFTALVEEVQDQYKDEKLNFSTSLSAEQLVNHHLAYLKHIGSPINKKQESTLLRIVYNCLHRGLGTCIAVHNEHNELIASNFLINSNATITALAPSISPSQPKSLFTKMMDVILVMNSGRHGKLEIPFTNNDYETNIVEPFNFVSIDNFKLQRKKKWYNF